MDAGHFKPLTFLLSHLVGVGAPKGRRLGCSNPAGGRGATRLRQPVPNPDHCWEGEVCRLVLFVCFFVLNVINFVLHGFWGSLSPGRLGGLRTAVSTRTVYPALAPAPTDVSLPKAGLQGGGSSSGVAPTLLSGARWHGQEVALGVPSPPHTSRTPPRSESLLQEPIHHYPTPTLALAPSYGDHGKLLSWHCALGPWVGFSVLPVLGRLPRSYRVGEPLSSGERKAREQCWGMPGQGRLGPTRKMTCPCLSSV